MTLQLRGICPLLQVFDMPASLGFYRDVLGFEVIQSAPPGERDEHKLGWAWLRHGDTELMLNTVYDPDDARPPRADPARVAAHEDTGLYIGCPDVESVHRHLLARKIEVDEPRVTYYGMKQLTVKDPDGFTLCFQWPADTTAAVPVA